MKHLDLLIHPGFGKTATTWFQSTILPQLPDLLLLGKGGEEDHPSEALRKAQYKLFNSSHLKDRDASDSEVMEYIDELKKVLNKGNDYTIACLSDESLLDFGGAFAERNARLLGRVIEGLNQMMPDSNIISHIVMTIREQCAILQSYYAYDFFHLKIRYPTFKTYIDHGLANPHQGFFRGLFYDEVYEWLKSQFPYATVKFVPFELLRVDPFQFLENIFHFPERGSGFQQSIKKLDCERKSNVNSSEDGSNTIRDQTVAFGLMARAQTWYFSSKWPKRLPQGFKRVAKQAQNHVSKRIGGVVYKESIQMDERRKAKISSTYSHSNQRIEKWIGHELKPLGYAMPDAEKNMHRGRNTIASLDTGTS